MRNVGYKSELTDPRGGKDAEPKVEAPWLYLGYAHQTTNTERVVDHPLSSKNKSHPVKKNKQPVHETPEDLQTALHSIPLALGGYYPFGPERLDLLGHLGQETKDTNQKNCRSL